MNKVATIFAVGLSFMLAQNIPAYAQFSGPKVADAKPGELRIMVTAAIRGPLDVVMAQAQEAAGKPIVVEYGSARGNLRTEILEGQDFEVAILLPDVNEELLKEGKILPESYEIARVNTAIGFRGDGTPPDVSTPDAIKAAMLSAKAVRYSPTGVSLNTVHKILSTLEIADSINDYSKIRERTELGPGEYELNLYPLSEIIPNKSLVNLGPVIPELQVPLPITAVVGKNANDKEAAMAFIHFLLGPTIDPALEVGGMMKGQNGD